MYRLSIKQLIVGLDLMALVLVTISCAASANNEEFFGRVEPPRDNVLRYITGDEPESLDPQMSTGQPESRIFMALYEGLVEYDARTLEPVPAIAESWEGNDDASEFIFHLRKTARWSNGDAITARDFVYSLRRGLAPELASRSASLAYNIRYAEAYNQGAVFVKDPQTNNFLLAKDGAIALDLLPLSNAPLGPDTSFHQFMQSPERLILPGSETARTALLSKNPILQAAVKGKEFVKIKGEDIGVEAVDDYTLRISLRQSTPFFTGLLANQFFRLVPQTAIEKYKKNWTNPANIVTCGPFKMKSWRPYNELAVERDPMYWDASNVHLAGIRFFPLSDLPTTMNLYRVGEVDAVANHSIISAWVDSVRAKKDYMVAPEVTSIYIVMNVTKPPMNDLRVRKAFDLAIDKETARKWRKIVKPLSGVVPYRIFPGYPEPKVNSFDPVKARQLLGEAGYPVIADQRGGFSCPKFPVDQVEYLFPSASSNKITAEFWQAQWKQNLGITVPLRSMEFRTFADVRSKLDYKGFAFGGFVGDYMDPYTFLSIFYTPENDNNTGWWDPKYVKLLDDANRIPDKQKRFAMLAQAEQLMIDAQPIIPIETGTVNWTKKPYVKGMYPNAASLFPWKYVYIERERSRWDYATPSLVD